MDRPNLVERAYELAKSGKFATVDEVARQLKIEGYSGVVAHLDDHTSLRRDLKTLCARIRTEESQ
jgi:hypothetical protein